MHQEIKRKKTNLDLLVVALPTTLTCLISLQATEVINLGKH